MTQIRERFVRDIVDVVDSVEAAVLGVAFSPRDDAMLIELFEEIRLLRAVYCRAHRANGEVKLMAIQPIQCVILVRAAEIVSAKDVTTLGDAVASLVHEVCQHHGIDIEATDLAYLRYSAVG